MKVFCLICVITLTFASGFKGQRGQNFLEKSRVQNDDEEVMEEIREEYDEVEESLYTKKSNYTYEEAEDEQEVDREDVNDAISNKKQKIKDKSEDIQEILESAFDDGQDKIEEAFEEWQESCKNGTVEDFDGIDFTKFVKVFQFEKKFGNFESLIQLKDDDEDEISGEDIADEIVENKETYDEESEEEEDENKDSHDEYEDDLQELQDELEDEKDENMDIAQEKMELSQEADENQEQQDEVERKLTRYQNFSEFIGIKKEEEEYSEEDEDQVDENIEEEDEESTQEVHEKSQDEIQNEYETEEEDEEALLLQTKEESKFSNLVQKKNSKARVEKMRSIAFKKSPQ